MPQAGKLDPVGERVDQQHAVECAAAWAGEVGPRVRAAAATPATAIVKRFIDRVGDDDALAALFYTAAASAREASQPWHPDSCDLEQAAAEDVPVFLVRLFFSLRTFAEPPSFDAPGDLFFQEAGEVRTDLARTIGWFAHEEGVFYGMLTVRQRDALLALDRWLATFSAPAGSDLWSSEALDAAPGWPAGRALALAALERFGLTPPARP